MALQLSAAHVNLVGQTGPVWFRCLPCPSAVKSSFNFSMFIEPARTTRFFFLFFSGADPDLDELLSVGPRR
jgi:hypothetical protein